MTPRRKRADGTDAPVEGAGGEAKPKKRASRKAKGPVTPDLTVPPPAAPVPPPPADAPSKPTFGVPVSIPIKPISVPPPAPKPEAPKLTIEPDVRAGEETQNEDIWLPPKKDDADLSSPPSVLLQRRKIPQPEVEDILEETDEEEENPERKSLRPPVRMGLYRKLALAFALLALLVAGGVMYVTYARAVVTVYPSKAEVRTERVLSVSEEPEREGEIPGEVLEVTVAGEKKGAPAGSVVKDAVATGFATLINETSSDQVLIPTTRLLSPDGVLFRIRSRVNVPARGRVKTEVYADQPGKVGEIGPTRFTIPGLPLDLQKVIYAESDAPMTGGTVSTGTASEEDLDALETALREELVSQAKAELTDRFSQAWTGTAFLPETMTRFLSAAPGETVDDITVRLTLRVRAVGFDRAKAVAAVVEDLKRGLTSDRELVGVQGDAAEFDVERADPGTGTATIRLTLTGVSAISPQSPLFNAEKLRGLDLDAVKAYFEGIEGIERVEVKFRPFWIKRMPDLADHIKFEIAE